MQIHLIYFTCPSGMCRAHRKHFERGGLFLKKKKTKTSDSMIPMADRCSECLFVLEAKPERRLQPAEPAAAAAEHSVCTQTQSAPRWRGTIRLKVEGHETRTGSRCDKQGRQWNAVRSRKSCRMEIRGLVPTINAVSQGGRRNYRTIDQRVEKKQF